MLHALSTKAPHRFTPTRLPGAEPEVTYLIEVPTRLARIRYRQRLAEMAGRLIARDEIERAFARALVVQQGEALATPVLEMAQAMKATEAPTAAAWRALARAHRGRTAAGSEAEIAAADQAVAAAAAEIQRLAPLPEVEAAVRRAEDAVLALDQDYRLLRARYDAQNEIAMLVGLELFLIGWEGLDLAFERRDGRVPEAVLERLPSQDVLPLGVEIRRMLWLDQATEKNSASPSN